MELGATAAMAMKMNAKKTSANKTIEMTVPRDITNAARKITEKNPARPFLSQVIAFSINSRTPP
jgi:hypothetical protein